VNARRALAAFAVLDARLSRLRLPSPRISALLVLGFLGFGVVIGSAVGSRADDTLAAASRTPLKIVLPAASAAAQAPTDAPAAEASGGTVEAPAMPPEATPQATPSPPTSTPVPAKAPTSGGGTAGGGESAGADGGSAPASGGGAANKLPPIGHVFVIMLSDAPYAATFGPESSAPYLARTLERRGALLASYYAVAHEQLANGIALLSGQGPTPATAANCPIYAPVTPATPGSEGQLLGEGCVYPASTPTLPGELEVKRLTWRAYVQGQGEAGGAPACGRPGLGLPDPPSSSSPPATAYSTFRNPIVYFEGIASTSACASRDTGLSALAGDLASARRTPSLSLIVPDRCHDASPGPCPGGAAGGVPAANGLLATIVPQILASKAYKEDGLLVITSDEAPSSGAFADSSSCCGQARFPNLPAPTGVAASLPPEGGGQVGALLLSPFVGRQPISHQPYNHFSLLRTIEDVFSLKHLGYADGSKVSSFAPSLFSAKPTKTR
jgi:hypothetical protein